MPTKKCFLECTYLTLLSQPQCSATFTANHGALDNVVSSNHMLAEWNELYESLQCLEPITVLLISYRPIRWALWVTVTFTANHSAPYIVWSNQMSCVNRCLTETMNRFQSLVFCRWPSNTSRSLIIGWQSVTAHTHIHKHFTFQSIDRLMN